MVYSASAVWATYKFEDSFFFAKRQLLFAGVGVIAMFFIMNIDYWTWRTWAKVLIIICLLCFTCSVLIPGIGMVRNGSRSWIGVGAFSIQPSEFMKLAMIAFLAKFLSENQKKITSFKKGLVPSLSIGIFSIWNDHVTARFRNWYRYGWHMYRHDFCCRSENQPFCWSRHYLEWLDLLDLFYQHHIELNESLRF